MDEDVLICPITTEPIKNPTILTDGVTYEKDVISKFIKQKNEKGEKVNSPITNEPININYVLCNIMATGVRYAKLHNQDFICPISREKIKIPVVDKEGSGYEYESLKELIQNKIKGATEKYYRVQYNYKPQEIIIPNKSLANYLGIDIGAMKTEYYDIPSCKPPTIKPIYDQVVRDIFKNMNESIPVDQLKVHFERLGIPIYKDGSYDNDLVIMNLDLSGLVLNISCKGRIFYNCNFSGSQFRKCHLDRCQLNYCNLSNCVLFDPRFQGEEVSFHKTDMNQLFLIGDVILEKGHTWNRCTTLMEVRQECSNRGGYNTSEIGYMQ